MVLGVFMECISIAPIIFVCLFLLVFVFYPIWGDFEGFLPNNRMSKEIRLTFSSGIDFMHKEISAMSLRSLFVLLVYPFAAPCMASAAYPKTAFSLIVAVIISANILRDYVCT
jgi:hypothetical protein